MHSNYEKSDPEKLACEVDLRPVHEVTLENWRAKLISLLLAIMVWYLIKKNVATSPMPFERPSSTPITETR